MSTGQPVNEIPAPVVPGPPGAPEEAGRAFPAILPNPEQIVWQTINDATKPSVPAPDGVEGTGIFMPSTFAEPAPLALIEGHDESYPSLGGNAITPIPVVRGWPATSAKLPIIGVALGTENEDGAQRLSQGGFAGDVNALDQAGKIVASAAYYAEPLYSVIIVELVHENRDERDRLHDALRARLYPLRHTAPEGYAQIKELQVQAEKQELPPDEQPFTIYLSVFSVEVWSEALIPTSVTVGGAGVVGEVTVDLEALKEL